MSDKRFTNHDDTIIDTDGEQLISTDEIVDKMNELHEENQHFKLKFRDMLEFIGKKGTVTKSDINNWWNTNSME